MGDYNGIGPEVAAKSLLKIDTKASTPVWIGTPSVLDKVIAQYGLPLLYHLASDVYDIKEQHVNLLPLQSGHQEAVISYGTVSGLAGALAMKSIEFTTELCMNRTVSAMVTSPISKEALSLASCRFPGHTEYLASLTGSKEVLMILTSDRLTVALCTIHLPLKNVAGQITDEVLTRNLTLFMNSLKKDLGIESPTIAVLALNPHAGDGGILGTEETDLIRPALQKLNDKATRFEGPFPADGFFASAAYENYDGIFAMYHDQGLIPFKMLSFGGGVNFTAGLPIIRTSPDHGTAFGIAGKGTADSSSFLEAYHLALKMVLNRNSFHQ